ncbi:hypothetical protein, partial [Achromobacter insuavis]|uniref:hypothetical protein n=1 Tax=Achromobacter insuavis TaxID=1287735 RepID=UPI001F13A49C
ALACGVLSFVRESSRPRCEPQKRNPRAADAARGFLRCGPMIFSVGFSPAMLPSMRYIRSRNRRRGDLPGGENG